MFSGETIVLTAIISTLVESVAGVTCCILYLLFYNCALQVSSDPYASIDILGFVFYTSYVTSGECKFENGQPAQFYNPNPYTKPNVILIWQTVYLVLYILLIFSSFLLIKGRRSANLYLVPWIVLASMMLIFDLVTSSLTITDLSVDPDNSYDDNFKEYHITKFVLLLLYCCKGGVGWLFNLIVLHFVLNILIKQKKSEVAQSPYWTDKGFDDIRRELSKRATSKIDQTDSWNNSNNAGGDQSVEYHPKPIKQLEYPQQPIKKATYPNKELVYSQPVKQLGYPQQPVKQLAYSEQPDHQLPLDVRNLPLDNRGYPENPRESKGYPADQSNDILDNLDRRDTEVVGGNIYHRPQSFKERVMQAKEKKETRMNKGGMFRYPTDTTKLRQGRRESCPPDQDVETAFHFLSKYEENGGTNSRKTSNISTVPNISDGGSDIVRRNEDSAFSIPRVKIPESKKRLPTVQKEEKYRKISVKDQRMKYYVPLKH